MLTAAAAATAATAAALQALYDSLIAEKAHNSRLQAEKARHKQRADAAERSTAALQKELQARQASDCQSGMPHCICVFCGTVNCALTAGFDACIAWQLAKTVPPVVSAACR